MNARNLFAAAGVSLIGLVACHVVSGESDTVAQPSVLRTGGVLQTEDGAVQIARCEQEPDEEIGGVGQRLELALNVILKNGHALEIDGDFKVTDESQTESSLIQGQITSIRPDGDMRIISLAKGTKGNPDQNSSDEMSVPAETITLHLDLNIITIALAGGGMREVTGCVFKNLSVLSDSLR